MQLRLGLRVVPENDVRRTDVARSHSTTPFFRPLAVKPTFSMGSCPDRGSASRAAPRRGCCSIGTPGIDAGVNEAKLVLGQIDPRAGSDSSSAQSVDFEVLGQLAVGTADVRRRRRRRVRRVPLR